jgi:hypothetical protein
MTSRSRRPGLISRQAVHHGLTPRRNRKVIATILRQILAPIPAELRGLRYRALLLTGFAGALRRPQPAAIRVEQLERTERSLRLTLPQTKGSQTDAVAVRRPMGRPRSVRCALAAWQAAAEISSGPVFLQIWLPRQARADESPPLPRIGSQPITP